jgi:HAD superfamily hydrolase (TIGR01548 family)
MLSFDILVFDMDGVLVEVSESYRETIVQTVKILTGKTITRDSIQEYKNRGGYNNDWFLSRKICSDLGVEVPYESVVETFNDLFLNKGMIHRERWIARDGLLDWLAQKGDLAIFTGRSTLEAEITLNREKVRERFLLVTSSDVKREKLAPDGLLKIAEMRPGKRMMYVGDTVDDARCAHAAGVPFIGIASLASPRRDELVAGLDAEGAVAILGDINQLDAIL